MVTISTRSCVSARSGAENQTNVMQVDEAGAAEQDQRGQPMELGLPGRADRAGDADHPDQRERRSNRRRREVRRPEAAPRRAATAAATSATQTSSAAAAAAAGAEQLL